MKIQMLLLCMIAALMGCATNDQTAAGGTENARGVEMSDPAGASAPVPTGVPDTSTPGTQIPERPPSSTAPGQTTPEVTLPGSPSTEPRETELPGITPEPTEPETSPEGSSPEPQSSDPSDPLRPDNMQDLPVDETFPL